MPQHSPHLQGPVVNIPPRSSAGHTAAATAVDWFPFDSGAFLSASKDCTAKLWDPNAAALVAEFATATAALTLRMAPSAHPIAAVGCEDGCIRLLDVAAGVTCNTLMGTTRRLAMTCLCAVQTFSTTCRHRIAFGDMIATSCTFYVDKAMLAWLPDSESVSHVFHTCYMSIQTAFARHVNNEHVPLHVDR